jgi:hypothetical protein
VHLTIGIHPYTWSSLFRDTLTVLEQESVEFRRSPKHPLTPEGSTDASFVSALTSLTARLADASRSAAVLADTRAGRTNPPPDYQGRLLETFAAWPEPGPTQEPQVTAPGRPAAPDSR